MLNMDFSIYKKYFSNFSSSGFSFDRSLVNGIKEFISTNGEKIKVLDFGCGMKPFSKYFSNCEEYIGVDIYRGKVVDVVYDGVKLPFPDNSFDLIISSSVLEHVEDINACISEANRVLKPNGKFLSVVPFINHVHGSPYDFRRPTRYGWEKLFKPYFKKIKIQSVDSRWQCVFNMLTASINNSIYFILRKINNYFKNNQEQIKPLISDGGASYETKNKLKALYFIMNLNPINFIIGIISLFFIRPPNTDFEGEFTSGYLISAQK